MRVIKYRIILNKKIWATAEVDPNDGQITAIKVMAKANALALEHPSGSVSVMIEVGEK